MTSTVVLASLYLALLALLVVTRGIARPSDEMDSGYTDAELSGSDSGQSSDDTSASFLNSFGTPQTEEDQLWEKLCQPAFRYTRYDSKTKKCYLATGVKGPCPNNLVFHSEGNNTLYGQCDCDSTSNDRTLIYHPPTQTCYFIFQKAICSDSRWLTLDPANGQPKCEPNPCSPVKGKGLGKRSTEPPIADTMEEVFVDGKCVKLGSKCGEKDQNGIEQIIGFSKGRLLPHCKADLGKGFVGYGIAAIQQTCAPGTLLSISGNCQSHWVW